MIPYIINVSLILAGCLLFYKFLLRKETFYKINRYFLVSCIAVAFTLPLLPVPQQFSFRKKQSTVAVQKTVVPTVAKTTQPTANSKATVNPATPVSTVQTNPDSSPLSRITLQQFTFWLFWIYWFGVVVFALNFFMQIIILLKRAANKDNVIVDGPYRIVEVTGDKAPCSFGNTIFINPEKYEWDTYQQIILHEKVHIRQRHTADILIAELMLIFQWFNPFAWAYRREVESNLEFLTDDQLTQKEAVEKTSYQLNLLKVSAPHFPLSLTTNYNQSILKKRIAMMNSKKSNLHTGWKYFFLLPVLALFACLLNEPFARGHNPGNEKIKQHSISTEGYWFAVIKDDKVNIRFSDDSEMSFEKNSGNSFSGTVFKLSDLSSVPKTEGSFTITREAGRMDMTGKFEGTTGMGRYKFVADQSYVSYMNSELKDKLDDDDQMAFFFIDVKKDYLQMLKKEGYTSIDKDDLIPMAALGINEAYIKSIKENGFKDVKLDDLVPLKALGVDAAYIKEIRDAGYKNITLDKLVTFKSQGIDKEYIKKIKNIKGADGKVEDDDDGDDIVSYKAMDITEQYVNSFKPVGFGNLNHEELVALKSLGVTPDYIKSFQDAGYKKISVDEIVSFKALGVEPAYIRSFEAIGYKNIDADNLTGMKSQNITPEYVKSFEAIGYKNIDLDELVGAKALGVTPDFVKGFEAIGFKNIPFDQLTGLKATGVTPDYITSMKQKGFNYDKLEKYITLKSID